jgi:hypothetical protein
VAVIVDDDRDTQLLALDMDDGAAWPQANLVLDHVGTVQPRLDLRAAIENRLRARRVRVEAPVVLSLALPEDDPLAVREEADQFLAARLLDEEDRLSSMSGGASLPTGLLVPRGPYPSRPRTAAR